MKQQDININKLFILVDMIEGLVMELTPSHRLVIKQDLNIILNRSRKLRKLADSAMSEENQEAFGEVSDNARELLDELFNQIK